MVLPLGLLAGPLELPPAIATLLAENCGQCHSEKIKTSGFSIISGEAIRQGGNKHGQAVVAGHPEQSALLKMLKGELAPQMPMGRALAKTDIDRIESWIRSAIATIALLLIHQPIPQSLWVLINRLG